VAQQVTIRIGGHFAGLVQSFLVAVEKHAEEIVAFDDHLACYDFGNHILYSEHFAAVARSALPSCFDGCCKSRTSR
jgi:hypothetical protein